MSQFYQIKSDIYGAHGVVDEPVLPEDVSFLEGRVIDTPLPSPLTFRVNHPLGEKPKHLFDVTILCLSAKLISSLRRAGVDNFQTFPAVLRSQKEQWNEYCAVNVIGLVNALVESASKGDAIMEGDDQIPPLVGLSKIVLASKRVKNLKMFRLIQDPTALIISAQVMNVLREDKPNGGWGFTSIQIEAR